MSCPETSDGGMDQGRAESDSPSPLLRSGRSGSKDRRSDPLLVITGLVPVIPILMALRFSMRDGRHKAGHDEVGLTLPVRDMLSSPASAAREGDRVQDVARLPSPLRGGIEGGGRRVKALHSDEKLEG